MGYFVEKAVFAGAFQIRSLELTVVLEHWQRPKVFVFPFQVFSRKL
ncbi:hypothetical protein NC652_024329 [Populus alba x Populus x berolinensis]|nr:hypothetical protein NC652_024329 [Populus alba x Populus x berolinensis]